MSGRAVSEQSPNERGTIRSVAPGRVNLIGDHTDYMGGLVLPMAIQLTTSVAGERGGSRIELRSEQFDEELLLDLPVQDPASVHPSWARYVAGVASELDCRVGFRGVISSTVPPGGGLSSSAALEVATALALGHDGTALELARLCQRAEQLATGVPCGIMDQLASAGARAGHAMLIDCSTLQWTHVRIPPHAAIWVVDSGEPRQLTDSAYATRRRECEAAAALVGPLPTADEEAIGRIDDPVARARARHVSSECERVRTFAAALEAGDLSRAGAEMLASHGSLRDDFDVSTPRLDRLVEQLMTRPGVHGARLTGAGFGGCVVALAEPEVQLDGWHVVASHGATIARSS